MEIRRLLISEEIYWRQNSRVLWLHEGDKNTRFFHRMANAHKCYNQIRILNLNGNVTDDPSRIKKGIVDFYQNLYSKNGGWNWEMDGVTFNTLSQEDKDFLKQPFSENEVVAALRSLKGDKAPTLMVSL